MSLTARRILGFAPWLKDPLWRKAQAASSLDLRFADSKSLVDSVSRQSLVTFTRASSATFIDSTGTLQTAATDVPRFDHNPITGESLGLLVEEQRTNLLLNSATLATQSVTVTAVAHTLSFYGTGTVTLSGTSTAGPAVGSGAFPARTTLTFTPTAGSLTLTVSGSVTSAQLEAGSFATSVIPTTTAAATRAADVASITGAAFSSWYRQDEGTVFWESQLLAGNPPASTYPGYWSLNNGATTDQIMAYAGSPTSNRFYVRESGSITADVVLPAFTAASASRSAGAYKVNDAAGTTNGGTLATDASVTLPTPDRLTIGSQANSGARLNGTIRRLTYFPARLPNTTLQRMTQ